MESQKSCQCSELAGPTQTTLSTEERGGTKHDTGKLRMDLIPVGPLTEIAAVLTDGAAKYAEWNWADGFKWSRLIGALLRHVFAWVGGEDKDQETGLSHMAHAGCCILFLLAHEQHGLGEDDRRKL